MKIFSREIFGKNSLWSFQKKPTGVESAGVMAFVGPAVTLIGDVVVDVGIGSGLFLGLEALIERRDFR